MKLRIAQACLALAAIFGALAVVSFEWAILYTILAVGFGGFGIGLYEEASRKERRGT